MGVVQKLFTRILPRSWAADMEAESRSWKVRCTCGHEQSVWDMGGIRWKTSGSPKRLLRCRQCGNLTLHTIYRQAGAEPAKS